MKNLYSKILTVAILIGLSACTLDDIDNPNAPTFESFTSGASQADVQLLAVGLEAVMRNDLQFHYQTVSIIGREYYDLTGVDPRFTGELLKGTLDNNGFLTTRAFAAWYKIVQSANLLITAVENSAAGFDDATKAGYYGYANTLKAYALMMVANRQYTNGIRLDVSDPDNLGPFVSYENALAGIMTILNTANTQLATAEAGGDEFDFTLSSGFAGFDTPSTFAEFN
ncbi:MAG: RagB/SusD family nutrient uptake outer membrane protein, partial [Cyclobacteriaceae bacterium]